MKKKKYIILIISVLIILALSIFIDKKTYNNLKLEYNEDIGVYTVSNKDNISIIDKNYQDDISKLIYNKLNNKIYTAEEPLLILNPYGTNLTGLYINFFTRNKTKVEYTISIENEDIPNFTNTLNQGLTHFHEGQIIGLIQGKENTIKIKLLDKYNKVKSSYEYKINVPDYNTASIKKIDSTYDGKTEITDGLYVVCSVWEGTNHYSIKPVSFYDKFGILRAEFNVESGNKSYRIEFINNKLLYAISDKTYILVNHLGKIEKTYSSKRFSNHEYIYNKYDNSILYINGTDKIRQINLKTGKDSLLLDLGDLLPEYKEKVINYHKENYNYYEDIYWSHLNSIEIVNKNDIILSVRQSSSIIYISNIHNKPEIKYIIAPSTIYENTQYTKNLLTQVGDFPVHAGQHDARIQKDQNLKDYQYYITLYNNNYAPPDYIVFNKGWEQIIEGVGKDSKYAENSMYYKYLIDEKEKTFTLVDSIKVPFSKNISNVQILEDGYLINSGAVGTIGEYNEKKELLLTLKAEKEYTLYRVYKHDMKSFWFGTTYSYLDK